MWRFFSGQGDYKSFSDTPSGATKNPEKNLPEVVKRLSGALSEKDAKKSVEPKKLDNSLEDLSTRLLGLK
ncbi:MAG TPA: hypothetical protein VJL60_05705 [Gammaproteobacteria bacterium]|nr:hypothetical protein [Gammaproteobacteria bacterium]